MIKKIISASVIAVFLFSNNYARGLSLNYKKLSQVKELQTSKGVRIFYMYDNSTKIINIRIGFLKSGSAYQAQQKSSLPYFYSKAVFAGTLSYNKMELDQKINQISAKVNTDTDLENFTFSLTVPEIVLKKALKLFASIITEPNFDEFEIKKIQANVSSEMRDLISNKMTFIMQKAAPAIIFKGHPYEVGYKGEVENFLKLSIDDLKKFKDEYIVSKNAVAAVFGNISEIEAKKIIDDIFKKIPEGKEATRIISDTSLKISNEIKNYYYPGPQSTVALILPFKKTNSPEYPAACLACRIIGGTMNQSRIFNELRNHLGLVYWGYIFSQNFLHADVAYACFETSKEKQNDAILALKNLIKQTKEEGITKEEFELAKNNFKGNLLVTLRKSSTLCDYYFKGLLLNRSVKMLEEDIENIEKLTLKEVNLEIKNLLDDQNMLFITVGGQNKE